MYDSDLLIALKTEHILKLIKAAEAAGIEVVLQVPTLLN